MSNQNVAIHISGCSSTATIYHDTKTLLASVVVSCISSLHLFRDMYHVVRNILLQPKFVAFQCIQNQAIIKQPSLMSKYVQFIAQSLRLLRICLLLGFFFSFCFQHFFPGLHYFLQCCWRSLQSKIARPCHKKKWIGVKIISQLYIAGIG